MRIIKILVVSQLIGLTIAYAIPPTEVWNKTYNSGRDDCACGVAVDNSGNIYVTGHSFNGTNDDFRTIKYDPDGTEVWNKTYDSGKGDEARGVAVDRSGYVYVTGDSYNGTDRDFRTIKYDPDGTEVWNKTYDSGKGDEARGVAVDRSGYVYVTGRSDNGTDQDFRTIKYASDGTEVWNKTYNSGWDNYPSDVAVDDDGFVYVTGYSYNSTNDDFQTIKYAPDGTEIWNKTYDSGKGDYAYGVAVDDSGNVYVAGKAGTITDYFIIKYDPNGTLVGWASYDGGGNDIARAIALDRAGCVFVTGNSDFDYLTVKFAPAGDIMWEIRYDSGDLDIARGVAVDRSGYVYVTGRSDNSTDDDFRTIKYQQYLILGGQVRDKNGNGMDGVMMHLTGAKTIDITTILGGYYAFFDLPCSQNYTVTPELSGYSFDPPQRTYTPLGVGSIVENFTATLLSIAVTSPNGGEEWVAASSHNITWTFTGTIANVRLEYSVNSGTDWIEITPSTTNDGSYPWTVPDNPSEHCRIKVSNVDDLSISDQSDADFTISSTGVEEANSQQPTAYSLRVSSNPFSEKTVIRYTIPDAGYKIPELKIYDVSGRPIRSWDLELGAWDFHEVVWDGTADNGEPVPNGIYFCRLETSDYQVTKKLILLR